MTYTRTVELILKSVLLFYLLGKCVGIPHTAIIMERDNLRFVDNKYLIIHEHLMYRANRTAPYTYRVNATILTPWYNNVTVEIKGYENHNNEYKESVLSFKHDICELFDKPNFLLKIARSFGNLPSKCPVQNDVFIDNLYIKEDQLPPFFPQSKWMISIKAYTTKQKIPIVEMEVYFQVVSGSSGKKKNKKSK